MESARSSETGSSLVTVLMLAAMLSTLLTAYFLLTQAELFLTKASMDTTLGFYAAEAGLNLRANQIRQRFLQFNRPTGTAPAIVSGQVPCAGGDQGSGDYLCSTLFFEQHDVVTYATESPDNPTLIVIPPGDEYQNLTAQEYLYNVYSLAFNHGHDGVEAMLEMHFRSRLVPLFQFAAFYNKDLEIHPGPPMMLEGPVHTNRDLYVATTSGPITFVGQVTTAGDFYYGAKIVNYCGGSVLVHDPANPRSLPGCSGGRTKLTESDVVPWNGMIRLGIDQLNVPPPESLSPVAGGLYWDDADLRVMLNLNAGGAIEVRDTDGNDLSLGLCGSVTASSNFLNRRESSTIEMLEVDVQGLLNCIHSSPDLVGGKALDDDTHGGLVWYMGVEGAIAGGTPNNYGVRLVNGSQLASTDALAPEIRGLTIVTNQAAYIQGDYNSGDWRPASVLADSVNILSNAWDDTNWNDPSVLVTTRQATTTEINAALLSGTDSTGNAEGPAGQDSGSYNGGLENYPRFHEDWNGVTLTYRGSFVSLNTPRHVAGPWSTPDVYRPPVRDWHYDTRFNDAANLPPLTPRSVYLRQDLFFRDYDL